MRMLVVPKWSHKIVQTNKSALVSGNRQWLISKIFSPGLAQVRFEFYNIFSSFIVAAMSIISPNEPDRRGCRCYWHTQPLLW